MQAMPGFATTLSDDELAQLANYLRSSWGGQPGERDGCERQGVALEVWLRPERVKGKR